MGPSESMPPFERPAFSPTPETRVSIVKVHVASNWAQILEGAIDSAHSSTLHSTDMPPARVDSAKATETGLAAAVDRQGAAPAAAADAVRLPLRRDPPPDHEFGHPRLRARLALHRPATVLVPPNNLYNLTNVNVPMDDTNTMFYFVAWSDTGPGIESAAWRKFCGAQPGIDLDPRWRKHRNRDNNFLQDRAAMKAGDFTGIRGIPMQDMAMWETMGRSPTAAASASARATSPSWSSAASWSRRRAASRAGARHRHGHPAPCGHAAAFFRGHRFPREPTGASSTWRRKSWRRPAASAPPNS
jgi:phthalate 4,5-dioxygenase oxygenase subunit